MNDQHRKPRAFIIEPEGKKPTRSSIKPDQLEFESQLDDHLPVIVPETASHRPPRFRWLGLLLSALFALFMMWLGLTLTQMIESFFAQSAVLGWIALAITAVAAIALLAIIIREIWGLMSLRRITALQDDAARAINLDDESSARRAISSLAAIYGARPEMQSAMRALRSEDAAINDPRDRMRLAERNLMPPLDNAAREIIARRTRRVGLLTTVTPAAALDVLLVAAQNFAMLREIAAIYGGRPSTLATLRLARMVATHLAVAGGLALSDTFIQHLIGKGILGRISARFGEGAVNGILTARIGYAALEVMRPMPKDSSSRTELASLIRDVFRIRAPSADATTNEPQS